jgi:hypothetical protein
MRDNGFLMLENCKECGRLPYIFPKGRKRLAFCLHGNEEGFSDIPDNALESPEAWNKEQVK